MTSNAFVTPQDGLRLSDYDYLLPPERIAAFPLAQRDRAKMMVIHRATGTIAHATVADLPDFLAPPDVLVMNNTQVLPCRVLGHRLNIATGQPYTGIVELFFLKPAPDDDATRLPPAALHSERWEVLCKPAKKLPPGTLITFADTAAQVQVVAQQGQGKAIVQVTLPKTLSTVVAWLHQAGQMPIPPYLGRTATAEDTQTYQTVFAKPHQQLQQSQAAPTAGLHMTPNLLNRLQAKGVATAECTLTVSTGTFREVMADDITHHRMDAEHYDLPEATVNTIQQTKRAGGRVVALGTTVAKTLETVAHVHGGQLQSHQGWSELFIYPGFQFGVIDALLTNFHLPKSTLLMLVSAFANRELMLKAYRVAVEHQYRFYSYGDCMLIL